MKEYDSATKKIIEKYEKKLSSEINLNDSGQPIDVNNSQGGDPQSIQQQTFQQMDAQMNVSSREYKQFKNELKSTTHSWYEKACNMSEQYMKIAPDKIKKKELERAIETAHLDITPTGVTSFSVVGPIICIFLGVIITMLLPYMISMGYSIINPDQKEMILAPNMFVSAFFLLGGIATMIPLQQIPYFMASSWRQRASSQMVLAVFYTVTYMRHTSNLELAIQFSSNRLTGPLAMDLKKVIWDIETEKYPTLKESLDAYLEKWRDYNMEFVEAMHLIESSLYEGSNERRLALLDKSLEVILDETYEKMLHFAHNLKSPMTTLNMLGFVLPILGLVILPLVVNFMAGVKWYYLFMMYDVALPVMVFLVGKNTLASRPTGYGDSDIAELNPGLSKYKNIIVNILGNEVQINPKYLAVTLFIILMGIGLAPALLVTFGVTNIPISEHSNKPNLAYPPECQNFDFCLLEERVSTQDPDISAAPFDLLPAAISILVPFSLAISIGLYKKIRTKKLIEIQNRAKKIEKEFSSALFQLGNRLGDGLPAEIAFGKVADVMKNTESGKFFSEVSQNITHRGMDVRSALFGNAYGVLSKYPSSLIESSMKVLVDAIEKSPAIAAQAIISISRYIKEMHRIDERLKDLLSDVISSMKSQSSFLAPVISAVVIGIASMITNVLGQITKFMGNDEFAQSGNSMGSMFDIGIPTYFFQIIVGVYIMQLIYILTVLVNGIENGSDKLKEDYLLGNNLVRGAFIYCSLALIVIIAFNLLADVVIGQILK